MERIILQASSGKILTNGEVYSSILDLAEDIDPNTFYEISEEDYLAQIAAEKAAVLE